MKSLSFSPFEVYKQEFFLKPLLPVVKLYGVANFYGCPSVDKFLEELSTLSHGDKRSMTVTTHVWFAQVLH